MIFEAEAKPIKAGAGTPVTRVLNLDIQPVGKCQHIPVVYTRDYDTSQGDHELRLAECKACGRHTFGHPSKERAVAAWNNGEVYDLWPIMEVEK
uniref:Restriction alleviation protein n=1 Tax=Siphoviridae sp. ctBeL15 TaxID=2825374 RepID=A0A8S5V034_9CAUD|nr:MAG TPA: restriction alleviation protein [Siphoviridae sp. ctBeL15]